MKRKVNTKEMLHNNISSSLKTKDRNIPDCLNVVNTEERVRLFGENPFIIVCFPKSQTLGRCSKNNEQ